MTPADEYDIPKQSLLKTIMTPIDDFDISYLNRKLKSDSSSSGE